MAHHNTIFHQVLRQLPLVRFNRLVRQENADKGVRRLDSKTQLIALLFHQFAGTPSLRRLVEGFNSQTRRLHHLGCAPLSRSTLADANATRSCAPFLGLFHALLGQVSASLARKAGEALLLVDSTTVRLNSLSQHWARFSEGLYGAKAHIVFDAEGGYPIYAVITAERVNDITAAKTMPIRPFSTYVFDLGYYDFGWFAQLHAAGCRIVTRMKAHSRLHDIGERLVRPGGAILSDRTGLLSERLSLARKNPMTARVREITVRIDSGKVLRLLTNDLSSPAEDIAALYRRRWEIELFFRWVKQALRIVRFLGASENAVRLQILVALIAYLLMRLVKAVTGTAKSMLDTTTLVRINLMHRRSLYALLGVPDPPPPNNTAAQGCFQWNG